MKVGDRFYRSKAAIKRYDSGRLGVGTIFTIDEIINKRVKFSWYCNNEYNSTTYEFITVDTFFKIGIWINITEERRKKLKKINESR